MCKIGYIKRYTWIKPIILMVTSNSCAYIFYIVLFICIIIMVIVTQFLDLIKCLLKMFMGKIMRKINVFNSVVFDCALLAFVRIDHLMKS